VRLQVPDEPSTALEAVLAAAASVDCFTLENESVATLKIGARTLPKAGPTKEPPKSITRNQ
jgi:hypothetical protein